MNSILNITLSLGGSELLLVLLIMALGMLAIFLVLKNEKNTSILIWLLVVFSIPGLGALIYLFKYFIIDKKRSL